MVNPNVQTIWLLQRTHRNQGGQTQGKGYWLSILLVDFTLLNELFLLFTVTSNLRLQPLLFMCIIK